MCGKHSNTSNKLRVSRDTRGLRCSERSDIPSPFLVNYFFPIFTPPLSLSLSLTLLCVSLLQASQPDELTIDEQEMLEVIEDGDMEDWVKVHKYTHRCAL